MNHNPVSYLSPTQYARSGATLTYTCSDILRIYENNNKCELKIIKSGDNDLSCIEAEVLE